MGVGKTDMSVPISETITSAGAAESEPLSEAIESKAPLRTSR